MNEFVKLFLTVIIRHLGALVLGFTPVIVLVIMEALDFEPNQAYFAGFFILGLGFIFGSIVSVIKFNWSFSFNLLSKKLTGFKLFLLTILFTLILSVLFGFEFYCVKEFII
jgi:hypothetical protein